MKKYQSIAVGMGILMLLFVWTGTFAFAAGSANSAPGSTGTSNGVGILNPIKSNSIQCFIKDAMTIVLDILSVVAVLYIMYAGFLFVKAQGDPGELNKAKTALLNALIGTALILGAWVFATVIANTINKITQQNVSLNQSCVS